MQWQTKAAAKEKDKTEYSLRKRRRLTLFARTRPTKRRLELLDARRCHKQVFNYSLNKIIDGPN